MRNPTRPFSMSDAICTERPRSRRALSSHREMVEPEAFRNISICFLHTCAPIRCQGPSKWQAASGHARSRLPAEVPTGATLRALYSAARRFRRVSVFALATTSLQPTLDPHRSCPGAWYRSVSPRQRWLRVQGATTGRLTVGSSLRGAMIPSSGSAGLTDPANPSANGHSNGYTRHDALPRRRPNVCTARRKGCWVCQDRLQIIFCQTA